MVLSELFRAVEPVVALCNPVYVLLVAVSFTCGMKYFNDFKTEFVGTLLMILFTFSAGTWFFAENAYLAALLHLCGVVASDKLSGGMQVNPAASFAMLLLGKQSYTETVVKICGQLLGGFIAFPLFAAISSALSFPEFGGPSYTSSSSDAAFETAITHEFVSMTILLLGIFILNWDFKDFGTYTYWIKQSLTGVLIRLLIIFFPFSGPAINPMLATTYDAHVNGTFSDSYDHYVVYWLSSFAGAFVASLCYALWRVDTKFLGKSLRGDKQVEEYPKSGSGAKPAASAGARNTRSKTKSKNL